MSMDLTTCLRLMLITQGQEKGTKQPWTPKEEYTLAKAKSLCLRECEIVKLLPGRTETSVKHKW